MKQRYINSFFAILLMSIVLICFESCDNSEPEVEAPIEEADDELAVKEIVQEVEFVARHSHSTIVLDGKMFTIAGHGTGGFRNDVWSSNDGMDWSSILEEAPFEPRRDQASAVFNGNIWVAGGELGGPGNLQHVNEVWFSNNGEQWTQTNPLSPNTIFSNRARHTLTAFDNKLFLIAGGTNDLDGFNKATRNDVWSSADGIDWQVEVFDAPFPSRDDHAAIVFNSRLWVIGGLNVGGSDNIFLNDVWYTTDGVNWNLATDQAPFGGRRKHTLTTDGNSMYLIGGESEDYVFHNDIWKSDDGINWEQIVLEDPTFPSRGSHTSVYHNELHWIINGFPIYSSLENSSTAQTGFHEDIWAFGSFD